MNNKEYRAQSQTAPLTSTIGGTVHPTPQKPPEPLSSSSYTIAGGGCCYRMSYCVSCWIGKPFAPLYVAALVFVGDALVGALIGSMISTKVSNLDAAQHASSQVEQTRSA